MLCLFSCFIFKEDIFLKFLANKTVEYLTGFILILIMVQAASLLHDSEIILPEIAALTVGLWIYHEANWLDRSFNLFLLPSVTAIIGFGINLLEISYTIKICLMIAIIVFLLVVTRSALAPSLATGLLPIIVNASKYSFIIAIVVFAFIEMIVVKGRKLDQNYAKKTKLNYRAMLLFLVSSLIWVSIVTLAGKPLMAAIPPVFVVFFETLQKPMYSAEMALKQIAALTLSALIGVLACTVIDSNVVVALITLPLVFGVLHLLKVKIPAAYAFPLLAMIVPPAVFSGLPLSALIASSYFLGIACLYHLFKKKNNKNLKLMRSYADTILLFRNFILPLKSKK